jgi:DNA-directed RNA polymerase subunit RPC12/RpoP
MPVAVCLPEHLDGAEFRSGSVAIGDSVSEGKPLASFTLADKVVVMHAPAAGVLLRILLSEPLRCRTGDPIALLGTAGEAVGYDPAQIECARLQLLNRCSECGHDYPVNGLVKSVRCTRCGDVQHLDREFWHEDVHEAVEKARIPGARGGGVTLGGPTIECRGLPPLCRKCTNLIEMAGLTVAWRAAGEGETAQICCTECGEAHSARKPPEWALGVFPDAVFVLGEVTGETGPESPKPVVFKCPSCLAALEIAGRQRIVRCKYCESDVYLPDDLWLHFNPASKRARWWLLFEPKKRKR